MPAPDIQPPAAGTESYDQWREKVRSLDPFHQPNGKQDPHMRVTGAPYSSRLQLPPAQVEEAPGQAVLTQGEPETAAPVQAYVAELAPELTEIYGVETASTPKAKEASKIQGGKDWPLVWLGLLAAALLFRLTIRWHR